MTTDSAQQRGELPRGERDDLTARPWSEWLPRVTRARGDSERHRRSLRAQLQRVQAEFGRSIEQSIGDWWALPGQRSQGLEVTLLTPEQERHDLALFHPVIRIGTDPSCQMRLRAPEISSHHCEIRIDEQALWCISLGDSEVRVNGQPLPASSPAAIGTGDMIEIGPFVLTVGMQRVRRSGDARASLELHQALHFPVRDPIQVLGENHAWARISCSTWSGFLKVPEGWLRSAYQQLGWSPLEPSSFPVENEVDRSLTAFVLHRMAQSFAERSGLEVNVSGVVDGAVMAQQMPLDTDWSGVRFRLRLGDRQYESECVWPREDQAQPLPWLQDLAFPVSVVGGWVALTDQEIRSLNQGDILLPDAWLPGSTLEQAGGNEPPDAAQHPVLVSIQDWQKRAVLSNSTIELSKSMWRLPNSGGYITENELPKSARRLPNSGGYMTENHDDETVNDGLESSQSEGQTQAEVVDDEPVDLERELEVVVAFELDRISVPLDEISKWDEGATVQLDRSPNDDVKILLRQGKGARLLGYGRAIVVDDKLGIQIQKWLGHKRS